MNNPIEPYTLEEVLDAYIAASQTPSREILQEWIKRHPQYAQELTDFTVAWSQTEHYPEKKNQQKDPSARLHLGMNIAHQAYDQIAATNHVIREQNKAPLASFFREGKQLGYSPDEFAEQINVPVTVIRRIESRLLLVDTIPTKIIETIAFTLQRPGDEIWNFLTRPPVVPQTLRLKSHQAPKVAQQQNFFDVIRADPTISEEQRAYWLSFETKKD